MYASIKDGDPDYNQNIADQIKRSCNVMVSVCFELKYMYSIYIVSINLKTKQKKKVACLKLTSPSIPCVLKNVLYTVFKGDNRAK